MLQGDIRNYILSEIKLCVPSWEPVCPEDISIENPIGIPGKTMIISQSKVLPDKLIFKNYIDNQQGFFVDRLREMTVVKQLATLGLSPKHYVCSPKLRIEEYLTNKTIETDQMRDKTFYRKVAFQLSQFHSQEIQGIDTQPSALKIIDRDGEIFTRVLTKLDTFKFPEHESPMIEGLKQWVTPEEMEFVRSHLPQSSKSICFSHNDLWANNILVLPPEKVIFIDFEFSEYNYRVVDMANFFAESCLDYTNPDPPYFRLLQEPIPQTIIDDFISIYVLKSLGLITSDINAEQILQNLEENHMYYAYVTELKKAFPIGIMLSCIQWGFWSLEMSHYQGIEFDFVSLANARMQLYFLAKEQLLN